MESIYYIVEGEMTLTTDDGETVLHAGDSFHCGPGTNKCVKNTGVSSAKMLVVLTNPTSSPIQHVPGRSLGRLHSFLRRGDLIPPYSFSA